MEQHVSQEVDVGGKKPAGTSAGFIALKDPELKNTLEKAAAANGVSLSEFVRRAVRNELNGKPDYRRSALLRAFETLWAQLEKQLPELKESGLLRDIEVKNLETTFTLMIERLKSGKREKEVSLL
jgi:hypothetical protein